MFSYFPIENNGSQRTDGNILKGKKKDYYKADNSATLGTLHSMILNKLSQILH